MTTDYRKKFRWRCAECPAHGVSLHYGNACRVLEVHFWKYHHRARGVRSGH